jgi:hypothetical protein
MLAGCVRQRACRIVAKAARGSCEQPPEHRVYRSKNESGYQEGIAAASARSIC